MPAIVLCLMIAGAVTPLADPDLPQHLAMGEWIVRHHAVPFREPFAWTRLGAPYFAYSWLAEAAYYLLLRAGGPRALHLLHGAIVAGAFTAVFVLGRAARWRPWATLAVAIVNVWVLAIFASYLRPQALLLVLVPLAWAFGYWILDEERRWWPPALGLFLTSALAANTHLFFVATGLPCWLIVARPRPRTREDRIRAGALVAAACLGWLATPYALTWPAVFRLFFTPSPIMRWPSPIAELQPGVLALAGAPLLVLCTVVLLALPWLVVRHDSNLPTSERVVFAVLWTAGLLAFGGAVRMLVIWWLAVLPWAAAAFAMIPDARTAGLRAARVVTAIVIALVPAARVARPQPSWYPAARGVLQPRGLPTSGGAEVEPLVEWLESHASASEGRIMTTFNFGSYLLWRLPSYSVSIDSRGIFPDSVLRPEAYRLPADAAETYGPWRSSDVVIIPRNYPLAAVLDTATGWRHMVNAPIRKTSRGDRRPPSAAQPPSAAALWVRESWWHPRRTAAR